MQSKSRQIVTNLTRENIKLRAAASNLEVWQKNKNRSPKIKSLMLHGLSGLDGFHASYKMDDMGMNIAQTEHIQFIYRILTENLDVRRQPQTSSRGWKGWREDIRFVSLSARVRRDHILSQINSVHILTFYFFKIYLYIIMPGIIINMYIQMLTSLYMR
jgi:hypothetical protein